MKKGIIAGLFVCCFLQVFPQMTRCVSDEKFRKAMQNPLYKENHDKLEQEIYHISHNNLRKAGADSTFVVPVVVHILYNTPAENISDQRVYEQINILNEDFNRRNADAYKTPAAFQGLAGSLNVEFRLAILDTAGNPTNGIEHIFTKSTSFSDNDDNAKSKYTGGASIWNPHAYLNIWVCNLNPSSTLGSTPLPNQGPDSADGILINYRVFGKTGPKNYDLGRTTTHEVGHYFNLYHTWGTEVFGTCSDADSVSDTPNQYQSTGGCPTYPTFDQCTQTGSGIMFMSFMDYSDDPCMNMFSQGQVDRMKATFMAYPRNTLKQKARQITSVNSIRPETSRFLVKPNPSSGWFYVSKEEPEKATLSIFNMLGDLIYSDTMNAGETQKEIILNEVPDGIYFCRLISRSGYQTQKIRIEH